MARRKERQLWVHRLSVSAGGAPAANVDLEDCDTLRVFAEIIRPRPPPLENDPAGARSFLIAELSAGRLRQGWSYPGLSLVSERTFLDNFVITMRRYWNGIPQATIDALAARHWEDRELREVLAPFYREARGRYGILERMVRMNRDDIVFVPNVPTQGESFTVATIAGTGYRFEDRTNANATRTWELDFGHIRDVRDVRSFPYSPSTLTTDVFGAPYRHAIDVVSARRETFDAFVAAQYQA